jgi:predicted transcriptional regulator
VRPNNLLGFGRVDLALRETAPEVSIESMVTVLNAGNLTPQDKLVLLGIANHDGDGGAWPSVATLARYGCCSERTIRRVLQRLVEAGLVTVEYQAGGRQNTRADRRPNLYHIHLARVVDNSHDGGTQVTARDPDGGTQVTERADIAVSAEPSLTVPYTSKRDSSVRDDDSGDETKLTRAQVRDIVTKSAFCPTCREKLGRCLCD